MVPAHMPAQAMYSVLWSQIPLKEYVHSGSLFEIVNSYLD